MAQVLRYGRENIQKLSRSKGAEVALKNAPVMLSEVKRQCHEGGEPILKKPEILLPRLRDQNDIYKMVCRRVIRK